MDEVAGAAQGVTNELSSLPDIFLGALKPVLTEKNFYRIVSAAIVCFVFFVLYRLIRHLIGKIPEEKLKKSTSVLVTRVLRYAFYFCTVISVLGIFNINLTAIWGAAGVAGVAIGFAAQTSVSNIISGMFVLSEKSLKIGDLITVGDVTGIVDEIHLLSVQIHTLDNQMVRIPNASIINTNLINTSYHPVRRMTIAVDVDYNTDLRRALDTLMSVPARCPTVIADPAPAVWVNGFQDSGVEIVLAVWFKSADFRDTKNAAFIAIKEVFDEAGIVIPYNRINVCMVKDPEAEKIALGGTI